MPVDDGARRSACGSRAIRRSGRARARAQQLVTEIAVAVLDVHEGVAGVAGHAAPRRRSVDQPIEIVVGQQPHAGGEAAIELRMRVGDLRLRRRVLRRARVAARVRELQADVRDRASALAPKRSRCARDERLAQAGDRRLRRRRRASAGCGLARPSCWTATASPPQINFAPLMPKRCQRRRVRSLGWPSAVPSQPSIGRMQNRLPTRMPSSSNGRASGDAPARRGVSSNASDAPHAAKVRAKGLRRLECRDARIRRRTHELISDRDHLAGLQRFVRGDRPARGMRRLLRSAVERRVAADRRGEGVDLVGARRDRLRSPAARRWRAASRRRRPAAASSRTSRAARRRPSARLRRRSARAAALPSSKSIASFSLRMISVPFVPKNAS